MRVERWQLKSRAFVVAMAAAFSAKAAMSQEHQHEHHTHEQKEEDLPPQEGPEKMGTERGMSAFPGPAELQFLMRQCSWPSP